jgi:rsbT antagonist protein RsbS
MPVPILKQGDCLIASIQSTLTDVDWRDLQQQLLERVGRFRSRGIIVDVAALDVMDSFATRTLRMIVDASRLRGAEMVLVGIQPEVALAMVRLGLTNRFHDVTTALDLEEGVALLAQTGRRREGNGRAK